MQTTVLIVEDNEMTAEVQQFTLETLDLSVVVAADGEQALKYLQTDPSVGLVITDMVMPGMDGLELIRHMKESEELKDIEIILCTGQEDTETVRKAAAMGCNNYLVKPVHPELLLTTVCSILGE
jgi:CheY-like chemotaxis protein